ncbi:unnamed protein product, partial [Dovyalis caffra]
MEEEQRVHTTYIPTKGTTRNVMVIKSYATIVGDVQHILGNHSKVQHISKDRGTSSTKGDNVN